MGLRWVPIAACACCALSNVQLDGELLCLPCNRPLGKIVPNTDHGGRGSAGTEGLGWAQATRTPIQLFGARARGPLSGHGLVSRYFKFYFARELPFGAIFQESHDRRFQRERFRLPSQPERSYFDIIKTFEIVLWQESKSFVNEIVYVLQSRRTVGL